ncbi:Opsin, ultraviolet-sensitive [Pseudolycoriella hygida]|uniref:Opsin, ultraviolet-sensitive n=1 Tax=Pseudolycoriella hygida TaxID=35572 RepID=A0A9Q0N4B9_9DIPT|nr:Opsin, ultraviolet-sensitive [Pseudolycoriella hygida]
MVVVVWCYSITFSIVPALNIGFSKYVPEGYLTSCSFDYLDKSTNARIFMFIFFIFAWCIPFCIITYCYVYILRVVISSRLHIRSSLNKQKTDIKLSLIVISVVILWFVAWTPYSIVALLGISGNEDKISPLGSMIPAVFCKASACIDPYVYSISHPRFRNELGRLFLGRSEASRTRATMRTSMHNTSYVGNQSRNPSIIRKYTVHESNTVNNTSLPKKNIQGPNVLLQNEVERETNFSAKIQEFQNGNGNKEIVAFNIYPEEIEFTSKGSIH